MGNGDNARPPAPDNDGGGLCTTERQVVVGGSELLTIRCTLMDAEPERALMLVTSGVFIGERSVGCRDKLAKWRNDRFRDPGTRRNLDELQLSPDGDGSTSQRAEIGGGAKGLLPAVSDPFRSWRRLIEQSTLHLKKNVTHRNSKTISTWPPVISTDSIVADIKKEEFELKTPERISATRVRQDRILSENKCFFMVSQGAQMTKFCSVKQLMNNKNYHFLAVVTKRRRQKCRFLETMSTIDFDRTIQTDEVLQQVRTTDATVARKKFSGVSS
uniref:Uncharacterized protein n=1 Tax=Romanomermis culicivorax TaxID=13658 RepID=A0A915HPG8_ROMCU